MDLIKDGWFHERGTLWPGQALSLQVKTVLHHVKSPFQDVLVLESTNYGNVLILDGVIQVTERDEFAYQEMMTHIPLFAHSNPQRVLVIGGGDGGILRELAKHPSVQDIVICELDEAVINVSKQYLPTLACGFDDPRVQVHIMDGNDFMQNNPGSFDVIITDSSDPVGPASVLFETPFYQAMYQALKPGGIVCTQGECLWLHLNLIQPLINSIAQFYHTVEYAYTTIPTYPSGQIGFILATKAPVVAVNDDDGKDESVVTPPPPPLSKEQSYCCIPRRRPSDEMADQLKYYTTELHSAAFVLPAFAKRAIYGSNSKSTTETTTATEESKDT